MNDGGCVEITMSARWVSRPLKASVSWTYRASSGAASVERELLGGRPAAGGLTLHRHLEEAHVVTLPAEVVRDPVHDQFEAAAHPPGRLDDSDPRRCGHPASAAAAGRSAMSA